MTATTKTKTATNPAELEAGFRGVEPFGTASFQYIGTGSYGNVFLVLCPNTNESFVVVVGTPDNWFIDGGVEFHVPEGKCNAKAREKAHAKAVKMALKLCK